MSDFKADVAQRHLRGDSKVLQLMTDRLLQLHSPELTQITACPGGLGEEGVRYLGFSPLINPMNGSRYGDDDFHPHWKSLQDHGGWFEMSISFGEFPFSFILFIEDGDETEPELRAMCREFSIAGTN